MSLDWPLTLTTQPSTSNLSNNPVNIYVISTQLKDYSVTFNITLLLTVLLNCGTAQWPQPSSFPKLWK